MKRIVTNTFVIAIMCVGMLAMLASRSVAAANDEQAVLQADHALLQAMGKADKTAMGKLLDADLIWTDSQGNSQTKTEILQNPPTPSAVEAPERIYDRSAVIRGGQGKLQVLRIWAKRSAGWQALGHKTTRTTERSYSHWLKERQDRLEAKQELAWAQQSALPALGGKEDRPN